MPDLIAQVLATEADRLTADEPVPTFALRRETRVRRASWLVPVAAMTAVAAIASTAALLANRTDRPDRIEVLPPPTLGSVSPAFGVRQRLAAPPGQRVGPAPDAVELLAVSPNKADGRSLHIAGHSKPRVLGNANGPLMDRCTSVYSEPAGVIDASCQWGVNALSGDAPLEYTVASAPQGRYLTGSAPAGTAAVLFRSDADDLLQVPTAAAPASWGGRSLFVAWWQPSGTDLVALTAEGDETSTTRLPNEQPTRTDEADPELGTLETPREVRQFFERSRDRLGSAPDRVDVLARTDIADRVAWVVGARTKDGSCVIEYVRHRDGTPVADGGGGAGCGSGPSPIRLSLSRSYAAGGAPGSQLIQGRAPAGTDTIQLELDGKVITVDAFRSGPRWGDGAYFVAAVQSARTVVAVALASDGTELARQADGPLPLTADTPAQLEAIADCLRSKGVTVIQRGEAYEYRFPPGSDADENTQLESSCREAAQDAG